MYGENGGGEEGVSRLFTVEERRTLLEEELSRIVTLLIEKYQPEKIVLFGSLARGHVHEWSDIDLLIIKETEKRPIERILEVVRLVRPRVGIDLFVYSPSEIETMLEEKISFVHDIMKTGKILYEKGNPGMVEHRRRGTPIR
ncbi:MAG: nucleotidyltransferase domain-containing protein [Candidatus Caldatribacterium sp.]|nr:nucleotidyltransferase domain-containing protein [Candidatus Caldatribacterium sp.]